MSLAFDFGNSNLKIGIFKDSNIHPIDVVSFSYAEIKSFTSFIETRSSSESVIISSVLKASLFEKKIAQYFKSVIHLDYTLKLPFSIAYKTPETLGKDRLAACAGASALFTERPLLVIDAGTCITYDYISDSNSFIGGAISPGVEMRLRAMHEFTGKLPKPVLPTDYQPLNIGKSTQECLLEGAVSGTINEINGFIATFSDGKPLKVILTGGSSQYLANKIENSTFAAPKLVLVGLQQIRQLNA